MAAPVRVVTLTEPELEALLERAAQRGAAQVQPPPEVLDVEGAAALLCLGVKTVRDWAAAGKLPSHRLGSGHRFLRSELLDHIRKAG
jgi:excisionase family DNA binding protein